MESGQSRAGLPTPHQLDLESDHKAQGLLLLPELKTQNRSSAFPRSTPMTHQGFPVFSGGAGGLSSAQRAKLRLICFSYRNKGKQNKVGIGRWDWEGPNFSTGQTQVRILTHHFQLQKPISPFRVNGSVRGLSQCCGGGGRRCT